MQPGDTVHGGAAPGRKQRGGCEAVTSGTLFHWGGIEEIIPLYASAYGDSGLTAQEVLEEILCDAMGQMNDLCHRGNGTGGR